MIHSSSGEASYQGSSTDEITLVNAAADYGFKLTERTHNSCKVVIKNLGEFEYEVLHKVDFTSERKKMSTVVQQKGSQEILVYTKGADNFIMEVATTEKSAVQIG